MNQSPNLLICFYGDDFTGSTDSMEALTTNGVKTVLFLDVPDQDILQERFPHIQAFGVAGVGRTMSPEQMEKDLKPILEKLQSFQAPIVHYKICSTFDSSPKVGSIGKVIDICSELSGDEKAIPILVGCPFLKRYTVFGNHFATVLEETYRLDRHPTMSKHPTTPMTESDLRKHLSLQTNKQADLISVLDLEQDRETLKDVYNQKLLKSNALLFDVLNDQHLEKIGTLLWEQDGNRFVIGSSGVEYALVRHLDSSQDQTTCPSAKFSVLPAEQLLVVSGSCSPVTEEQIEWALKNGFQGIKISTDDLVHPLRHEDVFNDTLEKAVEVLKKGESLVIYTSLGPNDPCIESTKKILLSLGEDPSQTGKLIGKQLGRLTKYILERTGLNRVCIAGGDTSGYATKELGVYGLEMIMPIAPGSPLCTCYSENSNFDGLEISLKGGQVGKADYFGVVRSGTNMVINN
jgi:uncharacterized protein YgbK (DUF1537 family)